MVRRVGVAIAVLSIAGCDGGSGPSVAPTTAATRPPPATATGATAATIVPTTAPTNEATTAPTTAPTDVAAPFRPDLADELVEMYRGDQYYRTGVAPPGDAEPEFVEDWVRINRLKEIIDEVGWPTFALVGEEGATGAWVVAQHADDDPAFQERALELLRAAVADGQGDPVELAYLEDRVRVNAGSRQVYGTQVRCRDGEPVPATPIVDAEDVDELRATIGLPPLAEYHREFTLPCADEAADGADLGG